MFFPEKILEKAADPAGAVRIPLPGLVLVAWDCTLKREDILKLFLFWNSILLFYYALRLWCLNQCLEIEFV